MFSGVICRIAKANSTNDSAPDKEQPTPPTLDVSLTESVSTGNADTQRSKCSRERK